jgi:hypothetical protein
MADLAITASDVSILATVGPAGTLVAGAVIDAGEVFYMDVDDDNKAKLAQSDGTAAEATIEGMAIASAEKIGQRVPYVKADDIAITISSVATKGTQYLLSNTPGKLCTEGDLSSTNYTVPVAVASAATELTLGIRNTGITRA